MEKRKIGIRRMKLNLSILGFFPQYTSQLSKCIQNLKTLALIQAEKSVTENLIGEKENLTTKGTDKQQEADSLEHNTTSHTQHLYRISKSKSQ